MQQNVRVLHRRTAPIVRCCQSLSLQRRNIPFNRLRPIRLQRRCFSNTPSRPLFLGSLDFPHLGGRHLFQIELPKGPDTHNIDAWVDVVDTCLPVHLRRAEIEPPNSKIGLFNNHDGPRDICLLLIEAQKQAGFDILEYLGAVHERWNAVAWIVQTVAEWGLPPDFWSKYSRDSIGVVFDERGVPHRTPPYQTLDELTADYSATTLLNRLPTVRPSLDKITVESDPRHYDSRLRKGALGQIWRSLGAMIVRAAGKAEDGQILLPHVLSLIATLHHHDVVPEAVYQLAPTQDAWSIQQPPLLHMLSAKILTALSDAAWKSHEAAWAAKQENVLGKRSWNVKFDVPGVRSGVQGQDLRPEVWLELVLWSCLYGGWVDEGAAVLRMISDSKEERVWSLICWQKILESSDAAQDIRPTFGWRDALDILEGASPDLRPKTNDKTEVAKTVSSEVVAAYVDALISQIHVGVGDRGSTTREVLSHIKQFKSLLGRQDLGLGFATWDAIVQRFLESGGFWLERDPSLMLEILDLVEPYGKELEAPNVPTTSIQFPMPSPYFFSASALPLGLLHRVLFAHAETGSLDGAMLTLKALQDYTELNQRRSIEQFFRDLKERPIDLETASPHSFQFDNALAVADYPSFFPRVQIYVLDAFLSVIKDAQDAQLFDWVLHSQDVDGPLIPDVLYKEPALAPALVRFATMTDNKTVLENVITYHSKLSNDNQTMISNPIITALMETQIERRRWDSISRILNNSTEISQEYNTWHPRLFSTLARELIRMFKNGNVSPELREALMLYKRMFKKGQNKYKIEYDVMFSQHGLLASVSSEWAEFVHGMNVLPPRSMKLSVPVECFNIVLQGVLDAHGLLAARRFWEKWCHTSAYVRRANLIEGGLHHVPRDRPPSRIPMEQSHRVVIEDFPGGPLEFYGKFTPNLYSVRIMLRGLEAERRGWEVDKRELHLNYDTGEMSDWLGRYFDGMSLLKDRTESGGVRYEAGRADGTGRDVLKDGR